MGFNKKELGLMTKLRGNLRAINEFRKIYNSCCNKCKAALRTMNGKLPLEAYCPECRKMVESRQKKIERLVR